MTTANMRKALYQTLTASTGPLYGIPVQQPMLARPTAAVTWAVIANEGSSLITERDPNRTRDYFRIYIYKKTDDETELDALADAVKLAIHEKLISGTGTGQVRFTWLSTTPPYYAEEYGCRAVDLLFRTLRTEI